MTVHLPPVSEGPPAPALAAEFPQPTRRQWQRLVGDVLRKSGKGDLDGEQAEQALSTVLEDGVVARPLYTAADAAALPDPGYPGLAPFVRGGRAQGSAVGGWDVRQAHADPSPVRTHDAVLADLEHGVTSLWLTLGPAGLPIGDLAAVLDGVYLDLIAVVLDAGPDFAAAAGQLSALHTERGVTGEAATGNLGADPLGLLARTGAAAASPDDIADLSAAACALAVRSASTHPRLRTMTVDALAYHDAGASSAQELGCALATGVAYLRELTAAGMSAQGAAEQLEFRYASTADQFLTIAKLRAARRLWARVAEVSGITGTAAAQRQHAVTSAVMMAARDPWVNMLRTTVACLAAGVGGADAVTVLPFDAALGLPDEFARRIARNTQSVLLDESNLGRVLDPAGGSWYVENLTGDLARAGWAWFQEIERAGGMAAALRCGLVGDRIAATWAERERALAKRREPVTGVSEFPHLAETPVLREPAPAPLGGGLPRVRRAVAFEELRARSDAQLAATGARPRLYLAALGPAAVHTARSSFAANLFQAGGVETVLGEAPDAQAHAEAFTASGAAAACICSTDVRYGEDAEAVAGALAKAGARRILLAGRPGEREADYRDAGIDTFVFVGCDAVDTLAGLLDEIGAAR